MKWFGKSWAPACDPEEHVDVPTEADCVQCQQPIGPEDQGVILPFMDAPTGEAVYHRVCFLRSIGADRAPEDYGANISRPVLKVRHDKLTLYCPEESAFKLVCPVCVGGLLLGRRDQETFRMERYDNCIKCGQRFWYTDTEIAGEMLPGIGEA